MAELNEEDIRVMLDNFRLGKATDEEIALLENWYLTYHDEGEDHIGLAERLSAVDSVWDNLEEEYRPVKPVFRWDLVAAAAMVILTVGGFLFWQHIRVRPVTVSQLANTKKDIPPGLNKATLTIAGSGTVLLDSLKSGIVVASGNVQYDDSSRLAGKQDALLPNETKMLTLQTPRGGTYKLVLPDGSVVWLNAASRLLFPSSFKGQPQRLVELDGEGYFEVAKNKAVPFMVKSRGQQVEVLGTHFNINSYGDEPTVKTTLLEGSVRIGNVVLKPGEQSENTGTSVKVINVDTDDVIGWKDNYIVFQDEPISSAMRKISRWYDVDIEYEGEAPADDFGGRVKRSAYISQVLKKLELTNKVHFKITGRRITVTK